MARNRNKQTPAAKSAPKTAETPVSVAPLTPAEVAKASEKLAGRVRNGMPAEVLEAMMREALKS